MVTNDKRVYRGAILRRDEMKTNLILLGISVFTTMICGLTLWINEIWLLWYYISIDVIILILLLFDIMFYKKEQSSGETK